MLNMGGKRRSVMRQWTLSWRHVSVACKKSSLVVEMMDILI